MGDDAGVGNDDAGGHGSVRYTYALQHQHGRRSSASSTGSGGRTSRPNLTGPADCMQRMQHTGDQAPARRQRRRDAGADDDDTDGRSSVRYTYALQHQQGGGSSASSDGSSGHVLFQAGSTGIGRLWIRAGGAARTDHARVAAEASTAAASCLPPAQTLTPRFWELEVVGIGASDVVGTVEKRPYFYVLGPTYMLVSDCFFRVFV